MIPSVSIIIPIYNVEKYIERCLLSIISQECDGLTIECILVNDCSTDNSVNIATKTIADNGCHIHFQLINNEKNLGLSAARNIGMEHASGEYIIFVDSDDLLVEHCLEKLFEKMNNCSPDLLIAGFTKMNNQEIESKQILPTKNFRSQIKTGSQAFLEDLNAKECFVWRAIYKKDFLKQNNIKFINGIYFEDIPFTTECYLKAQKCLITDYLIYIYRQRAGSILTSMNKQKVLDFHQVLAFLWKLRQYVHLTDIQYKKLMKVIFITFSVETWYISHDEKLLSERREIMADLHKKVPELHFSGGFKEWVITFLYRNMPNTYIKLRSLFC